MHCGRTGMERLPIPVCWLKVLNDRTRGFPPAFPADGDSDDQDAFLVDGAKAVLRGEEVSCSPKLRHGKAA
eukprot:3425348-Amphidinium_carterae.2